jgi:hypothetical protein
MNNKGAFIDKRTRKMKSLYSAARTLDRNVTHQIDLPVEELVYDSFVQFLFQEIIPHPSTTTPNNTVNLLLQKCLYKPEFPKDENCC